MAAPSWADAGGPRAVEIERKYWFWSNVKALLVLLGLMAGLAILALWLLEIPGMMSPGPDSLGGAVVAFLLMGFLLMFLPEYVESFLDATLRLEGDLVTYSWRHARPKEVVLDGSAHIEVVVAKGHETGPVAPSDILGYSFWRPGIMITAEEGTGFDEEDLVRIWPDVLAAACRYRTTVGPNLKHIVESFHDDARKYKVRESPFTDEGATIEVASDV